MWVTEIQQNKINELKAQLTKAQEANRVLVEGLEGIKNGYLSCNYGCSVGSLKQDVVEILTKGKAIQKGGM